MRNVALSVLSGLFALVLTGSAQAATPLDDALSCLKQRPVCIAQGTEGLGADTYNQLTSQLSDNDRIVIVMLPANALDGFSGGLLTFASQLDDNTGRRHIIGLSTGDKVVGYASVLPAGVANDLMLRAASVSASAPDIQGTFIRNVHIWLKQNPDAIPKEAPPPTPIKPAPADDGGFPIVVVPLGLVLGLGGLGWVIMRRNRLAEESRLSGTRFTAPGPIKELLELVMKLRTGINDSVLRSDLEQACLDTNSYFERNSTPRYLAGDIETFQGHLERVRDVLRQYIDVQNNKRYYPTYQTLLAQGCEAIRGYAAFALASNQRGADLRVIEFNVNTEILSAQRSV